MNLFHFSVYVLALVTPMCLAAVYSDLNGDENYVLHSRDDWGAIAAVGDRPLTTPVPYVVIHHTYLPPACNTTAKCKAAMKSMQNYHNSLGFGDIGYNFCVGSNGDVYEGKGWLFKGIHARQANNISIGICLIGDWRVDQPPQKMLETTKLLINTGVNKGYISPEYKVKGHSQVTATECPGSALLNIISTWDHFSEGKLNFNKR